VELSEQGFEMEQGKVQTIQEWKAPTTVKGVQEFIGFATFINTSSKGLQRSHDHYMILPS
jgi:hypothetical protein